MATEYFQMEKYKLETTFAGDCTIHMIPGSGTGQGSLSAKIQTKWRRKKDIGIGAFGVVWLEEEEVVEEEGRGRRGGSLRAVKQIPYTVKGIDWSRELDILGRLGDHTNRSLFVQFLGWYEDADKGYVYFAMEYIEHGDLSQYLEAFGYKAKSQAKDIIAQILQGLVVLHEQDICHRDIKPKNILVASTSPIWVKIADFGLSKYQISTSLRTHCGTTFYLAPELQGFVPRKSTGGGSYTNLVDIWSLGVLAHEVLTLKVPFLLSDAPTADSDTYSGVEPASKLEYLPVIDMMLFSDYCRGRKGFPTESLQNSGISDEGIAFVISLLAANPVSRTPAAKALKSKWLLNKAQEPYSLNNIALIPSEYPSGYLESKPRQAASPADFTPVSMTLISPQNDTIYLDPTPRNIISQYPVPVAAYSDTNSTHKEYLVVGNMENIVPLDSEVEGIGSNPTTVYQGPNPPGVAPLGSVSAISTITTSLDSDIDKEKLFEEMRRELQISREESRRAWEELGRREQEERERTNILREGRPTFVGGVRVLPMLMAGGPMPMAGVPMPTRSGSSASLRKSSSYIHNVPK